MVLEILEKNSRLWNFCSEILNLLKILSYNFQSRKQILTLRGVYELRIFEFIKTFFRATQGGKRARGKVEQHQ